jgi:hypothetical protein
VPDPTYKAALAEAYASAPANVVELVTIELRHPAFADPIRVVLDDADHMLTLEASAPANPGQSVLWQAFSFSVERPEISENAAPELVIEMDNVSREIEANIRASLATREKVQATFRVYLSTDPSGPQNDPPMHLTVHHIKATDLRVTARAGFGDIATRHFPAEDYTTERFPGLVR